MLCLILIHFVQVNAMLVEFQNSWTVFEQFHAAVNLMQIKVTIHNTVH